ncbi:49983d45-c96f-4838-bada-7890a74a9b13, partial [Thermothielavioides terrestris]
ACLSVLMYSLIMTKYTHEMYAERKKELNPTVSRTGLDSPKESLRRRHLGRERQEAAGQAHDAAENAGLQERAVSIQHDAVDRRAKQRRGGGHGHAHAHVGAQVAGVVGADGEGSGGARDDGAGGEAEGDRVDDEAGGALGAGQAQDEHAGQDAAEAEDVELAELVGQDAGDDAAEGRGRVDDGQQVRGQRGLDAQRDRVGRDVEQRREHADEAEEGGEHDHHEADLLERADDEEVGLARGQPRADGQDGEQQQRQHHEAHDADGPAEPERRAVQHLGESDGEDDAADGRAGDDDAEGGRALLVEVLRHGREGGHLQQRHGKAGQHALGEHEVPVAGADADHHEGEDVEHGARANDPDAVAVEQRAGDGAAGELDEGGQRPYPGDVVGRLVAQLVRQVVLLEHAERVLEAQAREEDAGRPGHGEPRAQAAVGGRGNAGPTGPGAGGADSASESLVRFLGGSLLLSMTVFSLEVSAAGEPCCCSGLGAAMVVFGRG